MNIALRRRIKMPNKEIIGYALEVIWNDGTIEVRKDFPEIPYINEYLDELEREEGGDE
jgi:hypothetical protein